jgi:glycosyltransferase involved in cell wall biosynthesis
MISAAPGPNVVPDRRDDRSPFLEVVVPVYNEEAVLATSIRRLHRYLTESFPYPWRIVIGDNASTDDTLRIARRLASELPGVGVHHLDRKGRGRALRSAWTTSSATVVAYMDVDLSTDLKALLPLVAPLITGHSDVAIGTRLARGAHVVRSTKREFISRSYNALLHLLLRARFSDAQCGFKAIRTDVAAGLLPAVRDEEWFFDTELLVLAERRGLRIHEVPVDWVEDPDSRVDIPSTAAADLRGVARLMAQAKVPRFLFIGVLSTIAYALLYLLLRTGLGPAASNAIALAVTAVANTTANRRLTFGVRGRENAVRHQLLGAVVFVLTLGLTTGALDALHAVTPHPSRLLEVTVLVIASAAATVTRYVGLSAWVFADRHTRQARAIRSARPAARPVSGSPG